MACLKYDKLTKLVVMKAETFVKISINQSKIDWLKNNEVCFWTWRIRFHHSKNIFGQIKIHSFWPIRQLQVTQQAKIMIGCFLKFKQSKHQFKAKKSCFCRLLFENVILYNFKKSLTPLLLPSLFYNFILLAFSMLPSVGSN